MKKLLLTLSLFCTFKCFPTALPKESPTLTIFKEIKDFINDETSIIEDAFLQVIIYPLALNTLETVKASYEKRDNINITSGFCTTTDISDISWELAKQII